MDAVWYGIANLFEWCFGFFKAMSGAVNMLYMLIGAVGTIYWIGVMMKNKEDKGWYPSRDKYFDVY